MYCVLCQTAWLVITLLQVYTWNNTTVYILQLRGRVCNTLRTTEAKVLHTTAENIEAGKGQQKLGNTTYQQGGEFDEPVKMGKITIIMAYQSLCWRTPMLPLGDKQQKTEWNSSVWSYTAAESALERNSNTDSNASKHTYKHTHTQRSSMIQHCQPQQHRTGPEPNNKLPTN